MTDVKVLERGGDGQCPSMEERERVTNEVNSQIIISLTAWYSLQWYTRMEACCFYQHD